MRRNTILANDFLASKVFFLGRVSCYSSRARRRTSGARMGASPRAARSQPSLHQHGGL